MATHQRTNQDLVDYLVTAILEQDAPFVLFWLGEMKARGMLAMKAGEPAEGVVWFHSWRPYTALTAAVDGEDTTIRRFVLECLLHFVPRCGNGEARATAIREGKTWATEVMARWETGGREKAKALALPPGEAADLLDEHKLAPPDDAELTGDGPLPPPPAALGTAPPAEGRETASQRRPVGQPAPAHLAAGDAGPQLGQYQPSRTTQSDLPFSPFSTTSLPPRSVPAPLPTSVDTSSFPHDLSTLAGAAQDDRLRLHLGNLPGDATEDEVKALIRWANIPFDRFFLADHRNCKSAYFTVPSRADFLAASSILHTARLRTHTLHLEPNSATPSAAHPTVLVRPLPLAGSDDLVKTLSRAARCGAYNSRMLSSGGEGVGAFKVAGPVWAQDAVDFLDGRQVAGRVVKARWYPPGWTSGAGGSGTGPTVPRAEEKVAEGTTIAVVEARRSPAEHATTDVGAAAVEEAGTPSPREKAPLAPGPADDLDSEDIDGVPLVPFQGASDVDSDLDGEPLALSDANDDIDAGATPSTSPSSALFSSSPFTSTSTALPYPTPTPEPDSSAVSGSKRPASGSKRPAGEMGGAGEEGGKGEKKRRRKKRRCRRNRA
ncbi:hypothetical protein JCM8097_003866 [Rhodosporidiobolus ruineniae]